MVVLDLGILEMEEERVFSSTSYERDGSIEWKLCALHKFKGVVKDIQFDS